MYNTRNKEQMQTDIPWNYGRCYH